MKFGDAAALARVRFGISPLLEAMRSVRLLDLPDGPALHRGFVAEARAATGGLDLQPLRALQPPGAYAPDFINPPPDSPLAELDDELERMMTTPPAQIAAEVRRAYRDRPLPSLLEPFLVDPAAAVAGLAELVRAYWERALARHWPRVRELLRGDILYRARQITDGGAHSFFADIDPGVTWANGTLRIRKTCCSIDLTLEDRGLLFVPSAFVWPEVEVVTAVAWQPTIIYPARGLATVWEPPEPVAHRSLAALLGRRGAALAVLDEPLTTTAVARRLSITPGGASQHLTVLRGAGLVDRHRVGRLVLYARSQSGETLVRAASSIPDAATLRGTPAPS